ncbi:DUF3943 domain-containing protein [Breznakiella homolactica]|uniref:DUF3943 domain-containing protein n=1 Tax=Breznakiella homolactica TaxID=2798577 RepID=A0A7T7XMZ4_9SPIR|nr:DUF3943 domain-containing protein [Breznakiella homolactica]QQO09330.1 DUF3943 domain-containing protein [Breznakiella homolactica]
MKRRTVFALVPLCILLFGLAPYPCSAQEEEESAYEDQGKNYIAAIGETLFSNAVLWAANRFIAGAEYAEVSPATWKKNLTRWWDWDQSTFITNQIGHPYQGSFYHAAGRANGFSFYESIAFDALGSATWELFGESIRPALNDFLVTVPGAASVGEILHRLYLEAYAAGSPFAVILSPMHSFNNLVTRRKPEPGGGNIMASSLSAGPGVTIGRRYSGSGNTLMEKWDILSVNLRYDISYGDPYTGSSNIPFEQFDMAIGGGGGFVWYDMHVITDGYLFYRPLRMSSGGKAALGLTLNFDFFASANSDYSSNALNATFKYRRALPGSGDFQLKAHAGWTGIGAANFYQYEDVEPGDEERRNYGTGANIKLFLSAKSPVWGEVLFSSLWYYMAVIPNTVKNSNGHVLFSYTDVSYSYPVTDGFSIGAGYTLHWKNGWYKHVPNLVKVTQSARIFVKYQFNHSADSV